MSSTEVRERERARSPGRVRRAASAAFASVAEGRSGAGATLQTLAVRVVVIGVNVATGVLTARALGAVGRGEFVAIGMGSAFFGGILALGVPTSVIYNFRRYPADRPQLLGAALGLGAGLGVVAAVLGAVVLPWWLRDYSPGVRLAAQLVMLHAPVVVLEPICNAALEASGRFRVSNWARLSTPLTTLVLLAVMTATGTMTPARAVIAYIVGTWPLAWMIARLWRMYRPRFDRLKASARRLARYATRSAGIDVLGTFSTQIDQVLVVGVLAPALVGAYAVALSASRILLVVQSSVVTVLFPAVASSSQAEVLAAVGRSARYVLAATLLMGGALFAASPLLLWLLYGAEFMSATAVLRVLVVEVAARSVVAVLAQSFMALDRPGWVAAFQGMGVALSVPLMLLLVPAYGLLGAGLALLLSTLVRLVFVLASYPLVLGVRPPPLLLTPSDVRRACEALTR